MTHHSDEHGDRVVRGEPGHHAHQGAEVQPSEDGEKEQEGEQESGAKGGQETEDHGEARHHQHDQGATHPEREPSHREEGRGQRCQQFKRE